MRRRRKPFPQRNIGWLDIIQYGSPIAMGSQGRVLEIVNNIRRQTFPIGTELHGWVNMEVEDTVKDMEI